MDQERNITQRELDDTQPIEIVTEIYTDDSKWWNRLESFDSASDTTTK